ncbi:MAG: methane monooxygenase [Pseudomonadota bacterium]
MAIKKTKTHRGIFPNTEPQGSEPLSENREFCFFAKPRWKKLTEYEKLILYAQPNPDWIPGGLDWGDTPARFSGGRDTWGNYFTEMRCQDWYAFRDPHRRWQYPYVSEKADEWRNLQRRLGAYADMREWERMNPWWRDEVVGKIWAAFLHHEYGVFNAMSSVCRDVLSDIIRAATCTGAFDLLDNSQMIHMQRLFLSKIFPDTFKADIDLGKDVWRSSEIYAPTIGLVDELWDKTSDHCEILFALFMVHLPLFGRVVRNEFVERYAGFFGDTLIGLFVPDMNRAQRVARDWNFDLFHNVFFGDPEFGPMNQKIMQLWLNRWLPKTLACVRAFKPVFDLPQIQSARQAMGGATIDARFADLLAEWKETHLDPMGITVDLDAAKKAVA